MKKLLLITTLFLSAAHLCAMDENQRNYQQPKPIVIQSAEHKHTAFANKIAKRLKKAQTALETDALETPYSININLAVAYDAFGQWLNLFDASNKEESKEFICPLRKLFVEFKDTLNHEKVSGNEDYPPSQQYAFKLNLRIQKLADIYSN